jgi:hypothetical protein
MMHLDSASLAPPQRSIADFMAAAFARDGDQALGRAADELEDDVQSRLRTFWRGFDRDFSAWSDDRFDASDEWWEEKIDRFEEAEDEIVAIVHAFDHAFERIAERWTLSETDRAAELDRARRAFDPVVLKLAHACREAREQLICLYGKKKAGRRGNELCESAEDVDRALASMGL